MTTPTILVKKADGTTERMTLDEVRKMQMSKSEIRNPKSETSPKAHPDFAMAQNRGSSIPANRNRENTKIINADFSSPLEEPALERAKNIPTIKELKAPASVSLLETTAGKPGFSASSVDSPGRPARLASESVAGRPAPAVVKSAVPPLAAPLKLGGSPAAATMRDMSSARAPVGPVEEIQNFTLTDFRRLAADPAEAARRLKQKFINSQEESVLIYLRALEAWKQSPLYGDYIGAVGRALSARRPLAQVIGDKQTIQLSEIGAIAAMNNSL